MSELRNGNLSPASDTRELAALRVAERREVRGLWPSVKDLDRAEVLAFLHREDIVPGWPLFARFLAASRSAVKSDPAASGRFAAVAAELTFHLPAWREPFLEPRDLLAAALAAEAEALCRQGAHERARLRLAAARTYRTSEADPRLIAEIDRIEAGLARDLGDVERSVDLYRGALARLERVTAPFDRARLAAECAVVLAAVEPAIAYEAACEVVVFSPLGSRRRLARGAILVAEAALEAGDLDQAEHALTQARSTIDRAADPLAAVVLRWVRARVDLLRSALGGDTSIEIATSARLERTIRELEHRGRERERAEAVLDRALASVVAGDFGSGARRLADLEVRLDALGAHAEIGATLRLLTGALGSGPDPVEAVAQARLTLRRIWWRASRSAARSTWLEAPEPFQVDGFPICRAGLDGASREGRFEGASTAAERPSLGEELVDLDLDLGEA